MQVLPNEDDNTYPALAGCVLLTVDRCDATFRRATDLDVSSWLDPSEHTRLARIHRPIRRRQFLAGRWLLRELLSNGGRAGRPQDWRLSGAEGAAPLVTWSPAKPPPGELFLGLSHSGEHIAAAVSARPLGLDIEGIRPRHDLSSMAALSCDDAEQAELNRCEPAARLTRFHRLWSAKEAWLKCWGDQLDPARLRGLHTRPATLNDTWWTLVCHSTAWSLAVVCPAESELRWTRAEPALSTTPWERWAINDDLRPPG